MVLFIPVLILLLIGIVIQILGRTKFNIVQTWIFAIFGAISAWTSFLIIKVLGTTQSVVSYFSNEISTNFQIIFHIDEKNWVYGFLLLTLLIAVILADSGRLTGKNNLLAWSGAFFISASGLFSIMSGSLIAFLITSALIDIFLFASQISIQRDGEEIRKIIFDFLMRAMGTILIMVAFGLKGGVDTLLIAIGLALRLRLISFGPVIPQTHNMRKNLAVLFDLTVPLSVFAFMSLLPTLPGKFPSQSILFTIVIFICISNITTIILNQNSTQGDQSWVKAVSSLAVLLFIRGNVDPIQPLSIVFCVLGGLSAFEFHFSNRSRILVLFLMVSMIGLPYSPSYGIWLTSLQEGSTFFMFFYNPILGFLILSIFYTLMSIKGIARQNDRWIEVSTMMSPLILLTIPWILEIWIKPEFSTNLNLFGPGIFLALLTLLLLFLFNEKFRNSVNKRSELNHGLFRKMLFPIKKFLDFGWILKLLTLLNQMLSNITNFLIKVLEGDGGLLWAFVFLVLISSIILTYRFIP